MASFGQLKLTNLGIQAQLNAQNGTPLKFTKIGMGSGEFSGDASTLTNLVKEEVLVGITKAYIEDGVYVVTGSFSNETLETTFVWREIGLYFEDENGNNVLYCYSNAGNKYDDIPVSTDERFTKTIRIATAISNAENVSIVESAGATYVEAEFFDAFKLTVDKHMASKENPHGVTAEQAGAYALDTSGKTINGLTTSPFHVQPGHYRVRNGVSTEYNWPVDDTTNCNGTLLVLGSVDTPAQNKGYRVYLYFDNKPRFYYAVEWYGNIPSWHSFLDLAGGTMKGHLYLKESSLFKKRLLNNINYYSREFVASVGSEPGAVFDLYNEDTGEWLSRLALTPTDIKAKLNGYSGNYRLYGEHNKPSGTYTGNGSATARTVNVGGIGNVLMIYSTAGVIGFVTSIGGAFFGIVDSNIKYFASSALKFENGVLTVASTEPAVNNSGTVYNYYLL